LRKKDILPISLAPAVMVWALVSHCLVSPRG
jgi:hypothetical protein